MRVIELHMLILALFIILPWSLGCFFSFDWNEIFVSFQKEKLMFIINEVGHHPVTVNLFQGLCFFYLTYSFTLQSIVSYLLYFIGSFQLNILLLIWAYHSGLNIDWPVNYMSISDISYWNMKSENYPTKMFVSIGPL